MSVLTISFVDSRIELEELNELKKRKIHLIYCPKAKNLYEAISCHPDIHLHIIDKNTIIVHRDFPENLICDLKNLNINVYR